MTGLGEDVWNGEVPSASSDDFAALRRAAEAAKDDPEADCELINMLDSEFVLALLDRLEKAEGENSALKEWSDQIVLSETEELRQDLAAAYRAINDGRVFTGAEKHSEIRAKARTFVENEHD